MGTSCVVAIFSDRSPASITCPASIAAHNSFGPMEVVWRYLRNVVQRMVEHSSAGLGSLITSRALRLRVRCKAISVWR